MSFNNPFKTPGFDPFSSTLSSNEKPGSPPNNNPQNTIPNFGGQPRDRNPLDPLYRKPLDPPGFGTREALDPVYQNPLEPLKSHADPTVPTSTPKSSGIFDGLSKTFSKRAKK